jgi:hypothetical protein
MKPISLYWAMAISKVFHGAERLLTKRLGIAATASKREATLNKRGIGSKKY